MFRVKPVLRIASLGAAVMLMLLGGTARAAPPPNDTFANATVISSLPFSDTLKTTEATVDQTDSDVLNACGFSGIPISSSVWYAFTPSTDQAVVVDTAGTTYFAGVGVVTGTPGSFASVACNGVGVVFLAHAGQTYYMDVLAVFGAGGTLNISVHVLAPPVLTVNPVGLFDSNTGAATVSGTVSCPSGVSFPQISTTLVERIGHGAVSGSMSEPVTSRGPTPEPWSTTIQPSIGSSSLAATRTQE